MVELKSEFDQALVKVLEELSELNVSSVDRFILNPSAEERRGMIDYFLVLQSELTEKTTLLAKFQQDLHEKCNHILRTNIYGIYQDKPLDSDLEVEDFRYLPDVRFLPELFQITTKSDSISAQHLQELENYLQLGGEYSIRWEPVG